MWASKAPALVAALVQQVSIWPDLAGVAVRDGPQLADESVTELVTIGWTGQDDGESDIESEITVDALGNPDRELCTIRGEVSVLQGGADIAAVRTRAYALLSAAGSAIAADRTLSKLALRAQITSASLTQSQNSEGAEAFLLFTVECDAFTAR